MNEPIIISLELNRMKLAMQTAITDCNDEFAKNISLEVERYCSSENLSKVIREQVKTSVDKVIAISIESHFLYGAGRASIDELVHGALGVSDE